MQLLPQSLRERLGGGRRLRCLSSRNFREVYLVEDSLGSWRVFKIARQCDSETLVRFQQVREALKGLSAEVGVLPVLDYGLEPVHGIAWEELPLADPALGPPVAGPARRAHLLPAGGVPAGGP
jgi:hypothetical protein